MGEFQRSGYPRGEAFGVLADFLGAGPQKIHKPMAPPLTAPMAAQISFRDPASGAWIDTGRHEVPGISVQTWADGKTVYPLK